MLLRWWTRYERWLGRQRFPLMVPLYVLTVIVPTVIIALFAVMVCVMLIFFIVPREDR